MPSIIGPRAALLGALALCVGIGTSAAQDIPCEPSTTVRQALSGLPKPTGNAERDRAARIEALRALLRRFPRDVFVHERYQAAASFSNESREAVIGEYRALAAAHPGDPLYAYLAARAAIGARTKEVIPALEASVAAMPPARLALARVYQSAAFKDPKKAQQHVEAFVAACPASLEAAPHLGSLEPSEFLTKATARLRMILDRRRDPESLVRYSTLWSLEFRVKPVVEHDALRAQVARDVKRLRSIDPGTNDTYYATLQEGFKLVSDGEGVKWAASQLALRFPHAAYYAVSQQFRSENPYPKASDPPETRRAGYAAYVKAYQEWVRNWPGQLSAWFGLVNSMSQLDDVAPADVEAAGEGLLKAVADNPGQMYFASTTGGSSFSLLVAHLYATRGVRPDRLPALVQEGLAELGKARTGGLLESDLYPRPAGDPNREFNEWYGGLTAADVWLKVKDLERARAALGRVSELAAKGVPGGKSDADEAKDLAARKAYFSRQADYWPRMASLAELEGRKLDAMTFYQNALLARSAAGRTAAGGDTVEKQARSLWAELGGSEEAWAAWSDRSRLLGAPGAAAPGGAEWETKDTALPDFDLSDLSGNRWRQADFKGRTTLVNVWSSG